VEGLKHWRKVREIGSSLDDADATDARLRACVTILSSAWRVHMTESEMLGCLNDARLLARQLGKPSAVAVAIASFATVPLTIGGRMGEALKYTEEALGLLNDDTPDADRITIEVHHSHTLRAAGRHDQALKSFERVSRLACGNPQFGRELIGFSPLCWAEIFKSAVLASTGKFDEWRTVHGNALHLLRLHNEREMTCRAQIEQILGSYLARITFVASGRDLRPIALEALHVAEATNNQHFQVLSSLALGVAHFLMGEFQACEEQISMFLQVARTEKNPLDHESYYVSVTADSCLARGDTPAAIDNAREAIGIAHKSDAWFQSALAYTIMADALARSGAPQAEVSTAIAQAHEFVQRSGGNSLLPRLRESEARLAGRTDRAAMIAGLREAETMWRTMGAPDPAERLAKELAS
jgi:tetratricopeptide (TPR) repeat protein